MMPTGTLVLREVGNHPPIDLCVHKVDRELWRIFKRHHYLSAEINSSAQCYGGFIGCDLVAFMAYIHFPHPKARNIKIGHRAVVLPDYQGLGISGRMSEWIGQDLYEKGFRYRRVIAHPAVIAYCVSSPRWRENKRSQTRAAFRLKGDRWDTERPSERRGGETVIRRYVDPRTLTTRSFEYIPPRPV